MVPRERFLLQTLEELLEKAEEVALRNFSRFFMGIPDDFTGLQQLEANINEQTIVKYHSDPHLRTREDNENDRRSFPTLQPKCLQTFSEIEEVLLEKQLQPSHSPACI